MISSILAAGGDCFGCVPGVSGNHPVVELLQKHRFKRPENKKYPAANATKHLQSFVLNDGVLFIELITGAADGMNQTAVGASLLRRSLICQSTVRSASKKLYPHMTSSMVSLERPMPFFRAGYAGRANSLGVSSVLTPSYKNEYQD